MRKMMMMMMTMIVILMIMMMIILSSYATHKMNKVPCVLCNTQMIIFER